MKKSVYILLICLTPLLINAQEKAAKDTLEEEVKTGFSLGGVPAIAYESDLGFRYGIILNLYHYGDGSNYPNYDHSFYTEWSKTTKGNEKLKLIYDSKTLIPRTRITAEASYITEKALDFFGFNGYEAYYNPDFKNDTHDDYISRMYYAHERKMLRLKADFQGDIGETNWRWLFGFVHYGIDVNTVDIQSINQGIDESEALPDTALLYDRLVNWRIIPGDEANGGNTNLLKAGVVYDTRDNEANPNKGIWSEALVLTAPGFLGNKHSYTKLLLSHRQYFTLVPQKLTFAYRLSYQPKIGGSMPFYMMPFYFDSKKTQDGLGGSKTLRGIMRNRVAGEGFVNGNFEFRWKFWKFNLMNQNFYLALSTFLDAGRITEPYNFSTQHVEAGYGFTKEQNLNMLNYQDEAFHYSYGLGLHIAMNNNFIVAVDYGLAADSQDGTNGLYIGLDFVF